MSRWSDRSGDEIPTRFDRRRLLEAGVLVATMSLAPSAFGQALLPGRDEQVRFRRIPTQFIAALAAPDATSGDNAHEWGLWRLDPGPRGIRLDQYERLKAAGGMAPAGWRFDDGAGRRNGLAGDQGADDGRVGIVHRHHEGPWQKRGQAQTSSRLKLSHSAQSQAHHALPARSISHNAAQAFRFQAKAVIKNTTITLSSSGVIDPRDFSSFFICS